jgi:branched-chain amino acid transport system permease protein
MSGSYKVSYKEDMAIFQNLWVKVWLIIFIILAVFSPILLNRYQLSILNEMGIATIGALGLNLLIGYTGQLSLGHGAFLAIGAYTSALLTGKLGIPFFLSLPLSGLMASLLGLVVGIPSLRLKGLYLALGTLAFAFIVEYILFHWDLTQGDLGMAVKRIGIGDYVIRSQRQYFYLIMAFATFAVICTKNLDRSKIGRSFKAIRDRDIAAEAMGIPHAKYFCHNTHRRSKHCIADSGRQGSDTIVFTQSQCNSNGKQKGQITKNSTACRLHRFIYDIRENSKTCTTNSQQNTCSRQNGNRQHK